MDARPAFSESQLSCWDWLLSIPARLAYHLWLWRLHLTGPLDADCVVDLLAEVLQDPLARNARTILKDNFAGLQLTTYRRSAFSGRVPF